MDLQSFFVDVRVLVSTVLLALGGCLSTGCSDQQKFDQMIELAKQGNAKISIQTPTQGAFTMKILGSEFSISVGSQGTITVSADYSVPGPRGSGAVGPLIGCAFGVGECNNMTADNCIAIGGTIRPSLCGQ